MKTIILMLSVSFLLLSCDKDEANSFTKTEPEGWIRIEIPEGREAYAIVGDINETLLVSTWTKAYYTTDRGRSWRFSKDFNGPVYEFFERNDTVFAMEQRSESVSDVRYYATGCFFFTTDYGITWERDKVGSFRRLVSPLGYVESPTGEKYRLIENYAAEESSGSILYTKPSDIEKFVGNMWTKFDFPFTHRIYNLYLDSSSRLYIPVSGGWFNEKNYLHTPNYGDPAIIYLSVEELP